MTDIAKKLYHGLQSYNMTWSQWKNLISQSFPDHTDYASLLTQMLNRQKMPNESWTTYYFEKMEMLRSCDITGKRAISCLIKGINDQVIQIGARAGRYQAPEVLYQEYLSTLQLNLPSTSGCHDNFYGKRQNAPD